MKGLNLLIQLDLLVINFKDNRINVNMRQHYLMIDLDRNLFLPEFDFKNRAMFSMKTPVNSF